MRSSTLNGKYYLITNGLIAKSGDVSTSISLTSLSGSTIASALLIDVSEYSSINVKTNVSVFSPSIYGVTSDGVVEAGISSGGGTSQTADVTNYTTAIWMARTDSMSTLTVTLS